MIKAEIFELMNVPVEEHNPDWLKDTLQAAIELEFATIPLYLCAFWSIKNDASPIAESIKEIVVEEMLHMGLVCNMLTGIGGTPKINDPNAIPFYEDPLPGGVHVNLRVKLRGLSPQSTGIFMKIEAPDRPLATLSAEPVNDDFTIGEFYSAIKEAFIKNNPPISTEKQIERESFRFKLPKLPTLEAVVVAIEDIKRQGEGSDVSPADTGLEDLAHYYRFGEFYHGKKLVLDSTTSKWSFDGDPVALPDCYPMAEVPSGGYLKEDVAPQVWQLLEGFDLVFTRMLNELQTAWETGDSTFLDDAVITMHELKDPAVQLMQIKIQGTEQCYGPCFRLAA